VFLIPGFLGIETLGDVTYFVHAQEALTRQLLALGVDARVHAVGTYATASMRKRTLRLCATIAEVAGGDDAPIHLVGHSTGGLDARLLCVPGVRLGDAQLGDAQLGDTTDVEAVASRVRSIVTLAAPHRGTPLATFFTTRLGAELLRLLSLGTTYLLRFGRLPLSVVVRMTALFVRLHAHVGRLENSVATQMFDHPIAL
jgi:triacylglycerol esterase/lipase EstA (alpha/beta hydrolase family)